jgi:hypothetical protein
MEGSPRSCRVPLAGSTPRFEGGPATSSSDASKPFATGAEAMAFHSKDNPQANPDLATGLGGASNLRGGLELPLPLSGSYKLVSKGVLSNVWCYRRTPLL